jgi:hypothetical protein
MPLDEYPELSLPTVGGDDNNWGTINNNLHQAWARQLAGSEVIDITAGNVTLTETQAQQRYLRFNGTPDAARTIAIDADSVRFYFVSNETDHAVSFRADVAGDTVTVPEGCIMQIGSDGTDTFALTPQFKWDGGFPHYLHDDVNGYDAPGLYFYDDGAMGLARRGDGVMGVGLTATAPAGDTVRFNYANTDAAPIIGIGGDDWGWDIGMMAEDDGVGALTAEEGKALRWSQGVGIGPNVDIPSDRGVLNCEELQIEGFQLRFKHVDTFDALKSTGVTQAAHGLGRMPTVIHCFLVCVTGEQGYAAGDRILPIDDNFTLFADSVNVGLSVASSSWQVNHKTTGARASTTAARWRIVFLVA